MYFFHEDFDDILPAHYTWKVPEKGLKINLVMCSIHCKMKMRTILACTLYSIKCGTQIYCLWDEEKKLLKGVSILNLKEILWLAVKEEKMNGALLPCPTPMY